MNKNACCFLGHRKIDKPEEIQSQLTTIIEELIVDEKVDTFLFGSKSQFNSLCQETVSEIKKKHPHIKRIYVRAEYPYINESYKNYLLRHYEETYYPEKILKAGKSTYIKRNYEMIDNSNYCIFYYDEHNLPNIRKSGTKIALDYAKKRCKNIINLK